MHRAVSVMAPAVLLCLPCAGLAGPGSPADFLSLQFPDAPAAFTKLPRRAGMSRFATLDAISFEGEAGPARLVVKFALRQDADHQPLLLDARVTYRPDGFTDFWQTITVEAGAFAFDTLDLSGPAPHVAGAFTVSLCRRASVMVPADPEECQTASGHFNTDLQID